MSEVETERAPMMDHLAVRVLLVDDDENAFILLRRLLGKISRKHFQVEWASSYQAGLEAIQRQQHDVYLIDYRLGGASGLDLLRKASALQDSAPIIILTGADDPKVDLKRRAWALLISWSRTIWTPRLWSVPSDIPCNSIPC